MGAKGTVGACQLEWIESGTNSPSGSSPQARSIE